MDNRAGEMGAFMRVVQTGSFAAAARSFGLSPSAISKIVARLEGRLGTRLIVRTTRTLQLTPEGETYYERALRVLADIDEAERLVAHGGAATPSGKLRVNASVSFGVRRIVPLVPAFLAAYPDVQLDLSLNDNMVDLVEDRADVAIRVGTLPDSGLKARRICEARFVAFASPAYLERHGMPETPADLARHNCLTFNLGRSFHEWPFLDPATGQSSPVPVRGNFQVNNGETMRRMALEGLGIARLATYHVDRDIEAGLLVPVLEPYNAGNLQVIHAVFVGHEHLATRVRAFVDFIAERIPRKELWQPGAGLRPL
ncbi:DNA-binding transcriptional regulator, LysR family [Luteibacter sp. UNCMF331Sha3.1]|uniref:LysR family transcriptional regulator n=1 Tax=Luteibacter sp. UNCMF331Sha3.1 TaxID=1502760 RepID=UPI0008CF614B|nr:LysR family transcriptional regulator [Luteibacter sp. UNCMF331Sha3.1]SEN15937.1 DNA-binding transcriptional regulator, LysR family [Luteibacter sp. UNCMF331Sha3.1]